MQTKQTIQQEAEVTKPTTMTNTVEGEAVAICQYNDHDSALARVISLTGDMNLAEKSVLVENGTVKRTETLGDDGSKYVIRTRLDGGLDTIEALKDRQ